MDNDVFKPISQRVRGAEDEENRRIQEIADELYHRCCLYEEELREGQNNVRLPRNVLKDNEGDIFVIDAE